MNMTPDELSELFGQDLMDNGFNNVELDIARFQGDEGEWEHIRLSEVHSADWYFKFIEAEEGYLFEHVPPTDPCKGNVPDEKSLRREFRHWLECVNDSLNPDEE